jgi:hypothetical protein
MVAAGLVGSTLGEQAAKSATLAKGMISIKRRRLVNVDMVSPRKVKMGEAEKPGQAFPSPT